MPGTDLIVSVGVKGVKEFNTAFKSMGSVVGDFGSYALSNYKHLGLFLTTIGGSITAVGTQVLQGTKNFEAAMRNVQTVSNAARANLQGVSEEVFRIGQITNTTAEEAARGLYNVVSSGFDGADAMKVLKASLVSATAGLTDTDTAGRAVSAVLNAYALSASEAEDVSDILFQTVNLGVGTFEELANAVGDVAGIAAQVGVPFADVAAAIAAASRAGQNFDEAATGVNRIIQDLLDPTPAMTQMLQELGFETGQAALQTMGLEGVMGSIRKKVGDNAAGYVSLFGRIEAVKTGLALAASEGENYAAVSDQITSKQARAEAAQKAFNIQLKGMNAQAKQLRNSLYIFVQGGLMPILTTFEKVGSVGAKVINFFSKLHPAIKTMAVVGALSFGVFTLLVGLLLLALPRAIIVAAVVIGRYIIAHKAATSQVIQHVLANNLLARSLFNMTKFMTNTNSAISVMRKGMQVGGWIGAITGIIVAFDAFFMSANKVAAGMRLANESMTDAEVTKLAASYGNMISKAQLLRSNAGLLSHDINMLGQILDKVLQTNFSFFTGLDETNKAFKELAKTNPVAARRMIESAKAAGLNAEAIYMMEKALWDVKRAQEETTKTTGLGASKFQTASGQMILLSDDIKEKIDDLRSSALGVSGVFGGMFGDAAEHFGDLKDAATEAAYAVRDANRALKDASEAEADARTDAPKEAAKNQRDLTRALRDRDKLLERKPRRNKGERREDYEARIADELADANERIDDANRRIRDQGKPLQDAINRQTDATARLTDAKKKQAAADEQLIITGDQLLARIKSQQRAQMEFFNNVTKLRQRLGQPGAMMISEVLGHGPKEGGAEAATLAGMSDKDLKEYLSTWKDVQAIATGLAMGDMTGQQPGEIQAKLEELWGQVGGNLGQFLILGAAAGEKSLTDFLQNKLPSQLSAGNMSPLMSNAETLGEALTKSITDPLHAALSDPMIMRIKAVYTDDSARVPGLTMTVDEFKAQGAVPITTLPVTAEPTPPPGGPPAPRAANPLAASGASGGGFGPLDVAKSIANYLVPHHQSGGLFTAREGLAMLHGPEAIIPMGNRTAALRAMQKSGLAAYLGGGGGGGVTDSSTHIQHSYSVGQVVAPDPAAFERWAHNRQRMNSLAGL